MTSRREFLNYATTIAGTAAASNTFRPNRLGGTNNSNHLSVIPFRAGLAAYSFRSHFEFMKGKPQKNANEKKIDMFSFIDYCSDLRCGAELTSYFFPPDADNDYFLKIKRHAFRKGVPIIGTAIGNNFTIGQGERLDREMVAAKQWIDHAAVMGAPHVRFFAGTQKQLESSPGTMAIAIESLQSCADYAASKGIFIGVENHGQLTADQVLAIVQGIDSDWFGVNLDTGNFISDTPYDDLARCAPHAVNVQLKMKMKNPAGRTSEADFVRIAQILAEANYRGYVVLEFEERNPFVEVPKAMERLHQAFG